MAPWGLLLVLFFVYGSALFCYKGQHHLFPNESFKIGPFYEVECPERSSCARYQSIYLDATATFYSCAKRCRGSIECCRTDLCNDKWIAEYQNITTKVVKYMANPDADEMDLLKMKIPCRRVRWLRWKEETAPGAEFKALQLDEKSEKKKEEEPNGDLLYMLGIMVSSVFLVSLVSSVIICIKSERYLSGNNVEQPEGV